ncbi:MAG: 16S rRNA (uracil(1498)-N(3))-methyltransferase [Alphaproteobacteria bacterium]|nr:16S rRNA (uracil(1498)-N(3))-methyltransferase [Alphaproteobacteria bacterium]
MAENRHREGGQDAANAAVRKRLFTAAALAAGGRVALGADQAHYLRNVLRLGKGDRIALFNGRDGEWSAVLVALAKGGAEAEVEALCRPPAAEPDLWLLFAPIKHARVDYLAQKAAELGVARLVPVLTDHTMVGRVNTGRLAANALEAAQQTGRLTVPEVAAPVRLLDALAGWDPARRVMLCDESGKGPPVFEGLRNVPRGGPWAVLIGPEGGFSEGELDALRKLDFVMPVSLGPRLLRADTAAVAALACWQAALGDWSQKVPGA